MENIPADYWLILCIIDYWLAPFTQNHISILTLQSVSTGGLAPGISLEKKIANVDTLNVRVSMPSRAYTSFLQGMNMLPKIITDASVNALSGLYLISTRIKGDYKWKERLTCQCPLGLIPHFYMTVPDVAIKVGESVSMPSRAYTSFLRYPFKNLGFMRFPEPVFAGIYQNILTTAVFRAC